ncbi:MAG: cardiolipin synthase, partial [Bacteroidales bacterium]|nr:cardiolipin synthase [Bacteroidales bacterium]
FTPNESILNAIKTAALSSIDVRIMLPETSDSKISHYSTMSYISELLDAGVKIYLFKKGFNHSKVVSIDGKMSIVGSANMDVRSFEHNFEIMQVLYNSTCAETIEKNFLHELKSCRQINSNIWSKRSKKNKILESLARLCSPLL